MHDSRGPRIAKSTPAACEQPGRRDRRLARPLVERRRATDPVEDVGRRIAGLEHAHAELVGPRGALDLRLAPRVRRLLDVAQHRLGLGREARVDHHELTAEVDDVVDVLDRDRAHLDARAAGDAVPDHLLGHAVAGDRRQALPARERERPLGEDLVAHAHDQELRREQLPGRVRRAHVLAAAALGAREAVDDLLPRQVGDGADAEADLVVGHVEAQRLEPPAAPRPREEHVHRGRRDVQVLRVRQVGEEAEDEREVRPDEDALEHARRRAAAEEVRERVRERRPAGRPLVQPGRDPRPVPARERDHDARDQREDQVGLAAVAPLEPLRAARPCGSRRRSTTPEQHEHDEEVGERREPALRAEPRDRLVPVDGTDHRDHDRREEDDEAPEDERVHQPGHEPLQQLALAEHEHGLVADARADVVEALDRLAHPNQPDEQQRAAREQAARDQRGRRRARPRRRRPLSRSRLPELGRDRRHDLVQVADHGVVGVRRGSAPRDRR